MLSKLAAALLLVQSPQQFDLECVGTITTDGSRGDRRETPWFGRYHIDLDKRLWCMNACPQPQNIHEITNAAIVFEERVNETTRSTTSVNRATGIHQSHLRIATPTSWLTMVTDARCTVAEYTPIPEGRF